MKRMTEYLVVRSRTTLVLVAGALAAWAVTIDRMRGMDEGPGTDLGGLGWYLGIWVTMTAAMMLPSAAPAARQLARRSSFVPTLLFTAGYLAVWTAYGVLAYGLYRLIGALDVGQLAWDRSGPYAAGAVIVAAGLYELTPYKRRSLRRCRAAPPGNAIRSGIAHGRDCVGCSGALMAVLFVLGVMSLFWMAVDRRRDLRREGAAARFTAGAGRRCGAGRARNLGRRIAGDGARTDRPGRLAVDADGPVSRAQTDSAGQLDPSARASAATRRADSASDRARCHSSERFSQGPGGRLPGSPRRLAISAHRSGDAVWWLFALHRARAGHPTPLGRAPRPVGEPGLLGVGADGCRGPRRAREVALTEPFQRGGESPRVRRGLLVEVADRSVGVEREPGASETCEPSAGAVRA